MINALRTALLVKFGLILAFDLACVILGLVLPGASHADTGLMWGVYIPGAPESARSLDDFEALIRSNP